MKYKLQKINGKIKLKGKFILVRKENEDSRKEIRKNNFSMVLSIVKKSFGHRCLGQGRMLRKFKLKWTEVFPRTFSAPIPANVSFT